LTDHRASTTVRHAAAHVFIVAHLTTNCRIRHVRVSVPLIAALLDNERYYLPSDLPPAASDDLRPLFRPRLTLTASRRSSPHRDAAPAQDGGNPRRAIV